MLAQGSVVPENNSEIKYLHGSGALVNLGRLTQLAEKLNHRCVR